MEELTAPTRSPQAGVVASDEALAGGVGGGYSMPDEEGLLSRAVLTTPLLLPPCVARVVRHVGRSLIQRDGCVMLRKAFVTVEGKRTVSSVGPCRKKVHWWRFAI